jgi:hypothetical protein
VPTKMWPWVARLPCTHKTLGITIVGWYIQTPPHPTKFHLHLSLFPTRT